jgi:TrwC relaxase
VTVEGLELLLQGRDPMSGSPLGRLLEDRFRADGRVVRAVSGFDATFSAPKSLSVWWALTGGQRLLDAHDVAVTPALAHVETFGSTTRIRVDGGRQFVETAGLTIAKFRQTTSRADDPQIHTHAVVSSKVSTADIRRAPTAVRRARRCMSGWPAMRGRFGGLADRSHRPSACRLHVMLRSLAAGDAPIRISAAHAALVVPAGRVFVTVSMWLFRIDQTSCNRFSRRCGRRCPSPRQIPRSPSRW